MISEQTLSYAMAFVWLTMCSKLSHRFPYTSVPFTLQTWGLHMMVFYLPQYMAVQVVGTWAGLFLLGRYFNSPIELGAPRRPGDPPSRSEGYVLGFFFSTLVGTGLLKQEEFVFVQPLHGFLNLFIIFCIDDVLILIMGFNWKVSLEVALKRNLPSFSEVMKLFYKTVLIFIPWDLIKIGTACWIMQNVSANDHLHVLFIFSLIAMLVAVRPLIIVTPQL